MQNQEIEYRTPDGQVGAKPWKIGGCLYLAIAYLIYFAGFSIYDACVNLGRMIDRFWNSSLYTPLNKFQIFGPMAIDAVLVVLAICCLFLLIGRSRAAPRLNVAFGWGLAIATGIWIVILVWVSWPYVFEDMPWFLATGMVVRIVMSWFFITYFKNSLRVTMTFGG